MDILLRGEDSWTWLAELKAESATRDIPVLVITSVDDERKGSSLGADAYCLKPIGRETLIRHLQALTASVEIPENKRSNTDMRSLYLDHRRQAGGPLHTRAPPRAAAMHR